VYLDATLEIVMLNRLTEDDIRTKAYELWEQAGCPTGERKSIGRKLKWF
jgi:hypothetical protein